VSTDQPILFASDEMARAAEPRDRHRQRSPAAYPARLRQRYRSLEAGTSLLIDCGGWLRREDFTRRFIITGTSVSDGTAMASIDWEAAITVLDAGRLPGGGGDAASCGWPRVSPRDTPFSLYDTLPGLDYPHQQNRDQGHHARNGETQA
jgi:hypothetical protein